ncbi:hypothetical protein ABIA35_009901 [Catenulispora sp. MAP12-49]
MFSVRRSAISADDVLPFEDEEAAFQHYELRQRQR